jgi:hypothetical protein
MNKVITPFEAAMGVARITVNKLDIDLQETKHTYSLVFDLNALAKANELTGRQLGFYKNWLEPNELSPSDVLAIAWASLGRFHPEVTREEVGQMFSPVQINQLAKMLFDMCFAELLEKVNAGEHQPNPPADSAEGKV